MADGVIPAWPWVVASTMYGEDRRLWFRIERVTYITNGHIIVRCRNVKRLRRAPWHELDPARLQAGAGYVAIRGSRVFRGPARAVGLKRYVPISDRWFDADYIELIESLFAGCHWTADAAEGEDGAARAMLGDRLVAVVMPVDTGLIAGWGDSLSTSESRHAS